MDGSTSAARSRFQDVQKIGGEPWLILLAPYGTTLESSRRQASEFAEGPIRA